MRKTDKGGAAAGSPAPETAPKERQVKLVSEFNSYQRLVLMVAGMLKKRGMRPHQVSMQKLLEVVTTLPPAIKLLEAQNWPGYFPVDQQRSLLGRVQAQMTFMEATVLWTGQSVIIEATCEHGQQFFCEQCKKEGRVRLDGYPY